MGSGLILFAIVIAWLIVLVPMALRSHDNSTYAKSADRFSHAMRVLSRRSSRDVLVPKRPYSSLVVSETRSPRIPEEKQVEVEEVEYEERVPLTAAQRRARTLAVLVGLALVTLGVALAGLRVGLYAHVACDLLVVAFVVHCRRQAILRAERAKREARRARAAGRPVPAPVRTPVSRIAGIPDRMPPRPMPLSAPLPAPAARYEDVPSPAAAATGTDTWDPVPVPTPTYVTKPAAPRREPRVLDLTKPGEWTAALEGDDVGLGIFDDGPELEDIIERRRAAGDW